MGSCKGRITYLLADTSLFVNMLTYEDGKKLDSDCTIVDQSCFRSALRQWATGITVVTSVYQGFQHGMTVSSFLSIALEPPLILISLQKNTRTLQVILKSQTFGVNILSQDQAFVSDRFAGRDVEIEDRFAGLATFQLETESPLLEGALANFDCRVESLREIADHVLVVGKVLALKTSESQAPLLYYQRAYHTLPQKSTSQDEDAR